MYSYNLTVSVLLRADSQQTVIDIGFKFGNFSKPDIDMICYYYKALGVLWFVYDYRKTDIVPK